MRDGFQFSSSGDGSQWHRRCLSLPSRNHAVEPRAYLPEVPVHCYRQTGKARDPRASCRAGLRPAPLSLSRLRHAILRPPQYKEGFVSVTARSDSALRKSTHRFAQVQRGGLNLLEQLDLFGHKLLVRTAKPVRLPPGAEGCHQHGDSGLRSRAGRGIPQDDHDGRLPFGDLQGPSERRSSPTPAPAVRAPASEVSCKRRQSITRSPDPPAPASRAGSSGRGPWRS